MSTISIIGSGGMAAAIGGLAAKAGHTVEVMSRDTAKARALAKQIGAAAAYARADVSREDEVVGAIALAMERWGRLDCMFNNAGFGGVDEILEKIPVEGYQETMDVLVKGVLLGIKHAAPIMKKQRSGSIINTGSVAGMHAGYGPHVYSVAKAAVIHLSRCAAMELGEWGVRVNCICPGGIVTPIFGKALGLPSEKADESLGAVSEALRLFQAIPRPGHPADIASAALFLASDESAFVNGHALVVDGGLTAGRRFSDAQESWNSFRELMGIPRKDFPRPT